MKFSAILTFITLINCSLFANTNWNTLFEEYNNPSSAGDREMRKAFLELAESDDPKAIDFFLKFYNDPPNTNTYWGQTFPDVRDASSYRGIAHVALVQLGYEPAIDKLIDEILYDDKGVRSVARRKAIMLQGDLGIELLSYFIGERRDVTKKPLGSDDWAAVKELSKRVQNPPLKIEGAYEFDAHKKGGREAWLKWRYENYGPIPGREHLFAQFAVSDEEEKPTDAPAAVEVVEGAQESTASEPATEKPAEVKTFQPVVEPKKPSQWWLWLIGAVVIIGGLGLVLRRKS